MKTIQEVRVGKDTGTYADVLLAVGVASLLDELAHAVSRDNSVTIEDLGDAYLVRGTMPINLEVENGIGPGYLYLLDKPGDPLRPEIASSYFDYVEEKKRRDQAKQATKQRKASKVVEADPGQEPSPKLSMFAILNKLRSGSPSFNKMHALLRQYADRLPIACALYLPLMHNPTALAESEETWEQELDKATASLQFFNPIVGKGIHRPKPDGTGLGGYGGRTHWFVQWLRLRGFDSAMAAYWINNEDVKVLVLTPGHIEFSRLRELRDRLLARRLWGNLRLDCEAALDLGEELIAHSEHFLGPTAYRRPKRRLNQVVQGLSSAYFKSLGAGLALTNVAFLGLPGWLPVTNTENAKDWLDTITEHRRVVRRLQEDHSDEVGLLLRYRDFISSGQLSDALEFFSSYAAHLMGAQRRPSFTTPNLRRLFMSYDENDKPQELSQIISDEGFLAVATAIRRVTVSEQYRKAITGRQEYEIRYGLAQEWKRKAKFRDEFVCELSAFAASFNAESARRREQGHWAYAALTTDQLGRLIRLIDAQGTELIGLLLLAFGYAREDRSDEAGSTENTSGDGENITQVVNP